jgi:hypothetical protein
MHAIQFTELHHFTFPGVWSDRIGAASARRKSILIKKARTRSRFQVLVGQDRSGVCEKEIDSDQEGTDKVGGDAATVARKNPIPASNFLWIAMPPPRMYIS